MEWVPVAIAGRLFTWARAWHAFGGSEQLGIPFVPVLVEFPDAGGIRLLGLLEGEGEPRIGQAVTGRIGATQAFDRTIPALRWQIAS
jgi:uncharacterized protein